MPLRECMVIVTVTMRRPPLMSENLFCFWSKEIIPDTNPALQVVLCYIQAAWRRSCSTKRLPICALVLVPKYV